MAVLRLIASSYLVGACTGRFGGLIALEDAVNIARRTTVCVGRVRAVGHQAATGHNAAEGIDRGQTVPGRQRHDQFAMKVSMSRPTRRPSRLGRTAQTP